MNEKIGVNSPGNSRRKLLTFVVLLFASASANADTSPRWVGPVAIDFITVQPNGNIYMKLEASVPDLGCNGSDFGMLELDPALPHFKEQYSLLLAAMTASIDVTVYVMGCANYYPKAHNTKVMSP